MSLFRYPGGKTWYYEFHFAGQKVRESAKTRSKEMARRAENARRRDLEESYHGLKKRIPPRLFSVAADEWLALKKPALAERSYIIEQANLKHLLPTFSKLLITDIDGKDISQYQQSRLEEKASPKTVNLEVGTLRAILRRNRLWAAIQPDVRMLPTRDDIGRAMTPEEETRLLAECGESRSRSLLPAVTLALNTCMRLFGDSPSPMAPGRPCRASDHRGQEQGRFRHWPGDSAEHPCLSRPGILGQQLPASPARPLRVSFRALRGCR